MTDVLALDAAISRLGVCKCGGVAQVESYPFCARCGKRKPRLVHCKCGRCGRWNPGQEKQWLCAVSDSAPDRKLADGDECPYCKTRLEVPHAR